MANSKGEDMASIKNADPEMLKAAKKIRSTFGPKLVFGVRKGKMTSANPSGLEINHDLRRTGKAEWDEISFVLMKLDGLPGLKR
jgi:hypothetical protein